MAPLYSALPPPSLPTRHADPPPTTGTNGCGPVCAPADSFFCLSLGIHACAFLFHGGRSAPVLLSPSWVSAGPGFPRGSLSRPTPPKNKTNTSTNKQTGAGGTHQRRTGHLPLTAPPRRDAIYGVTGRLLAPPIPLCLFLPPSLLSSPLLSSPLLWSTSSVSLLLSSSSLSCSQVSPLGVHGMWKSV